MAWLMPTFEELFSKIEFKIKDLLPTSILWSGPPTKKSLLMIFEDRPGLLLTNVKKQFSQGFTMLAGSLTILETGPRPVLFVVVL